MDSSFAPKQGYRYDGLYWVDEFWEESGRSGFKVWRYRLRKNESTAAPSPGPEIENPRNPKRRQFTTTRIVRERCVKYRCYEGTRAA
jgi:putative restriction endonuclease